MRIDVKEWVTTARETVDMVLFGVVMFFVVPWQNYKNRKSNADAE